jgi:hypothetical protein
VKLVLFGLRPSDADQYITGGAFKGRCGLFASMSLGYALCTGIVVIVFVQIIPE